MFIHNNMLEFNIIRELSASFWIGHVEDHSDPLKTISGELLKNI